MPAFYTHHKFCKDVFSKLNVDNKEILNKSLNHYYLFAQSFDHLFFYKHLNIIPSKKINKLGKYAHRNNVNLYFKNIITYIKKHSLQNNSECLAFLYGSITHYILDSNLHPYIIYKTGSYNKKNIHTYKYNGLHTKLEYGLDSFLYELDNNKKYRKYNVQKYLFPKVIFSKKLDKCIDYTFANTFSVNNMSNIYNKSYNDYKSSFKYLFQDPFKIKFYLYNLFDKISGNRIRNTKYHTTSQDLDLEYLNLKKETWINPCNKKFKSKDSILDLYNEAINKSVLLITNINKYFNGNYSLNKILEDIGNNSYITGIDISLKNKIKYFED